MPAYELPEHVVTFEETNVMGNVYFTNYLSWQGRCREMFLRKHAPKVLGEIAGGLRLITTRVSCEYFEELRAFDKINIKMYAKEFCPGRVTMSFDYFRGKQLVARGEQQIASMRDKKAVFLPTALRVALQNFLRP